MLLKKQKQNSKRLDKADAGGAKIFKTLAANVPQLSEVRNSHH